MICGNSSVETRGAPEVQVISWKESWQRRAFGLHYEDHEATAQKYLKSFALEVLTLTKQSAK